MKCDLRHKQLKKEIAVKLFTLYMRSILHEIGDDDGGGLARVRARACVCFLTEFA